MCPKGDVHLNSELTGNIMKLSKYIVFGALMFISSISFAAGFSGGLKPIAYKTIICDGNPRILVQFADATQNIWYSANSEHSDSFLSAALAATSANLEFWFMGSDDTATAYCIGGTARQVHSWGITNQ